MEPLLWSIVLLLIGLLLMALELFVPSGGSLGVFSAICFIAAIIYAYYHSALAGTIVLIGEMVLVPVAIGLLIKIWPHTPIGKRMILNLPVDAQATVPQTEEYQRKLGLVGKVGVAKSRMMPSGAIVVENFTYDAVSEGMPIDTGNRVEVVQVGGNRIVVRPTEKPLSVSDVVVDDGYIDPLNIPIEQLGIDPFDDEPLR
ncbi:MAG: membrane-bound ClpP family serine protease [Pirellulaceae bacterium]|jgi:membrane-bound ClpP family serine protease